MIAEYAQQGTGQDALNLHRIVQVQVLALVSVTRTCLLQACTSVGLLGLHDEWRLHLRID